MSEPDQSPTPDRLTDLLEEGAHEATMACLDRLGESDDKTRKRALRAARDAAEEQPDTFEELAAPLSTFLTDENRAVRLTTAKLFVTLAQSDPTAVEPAVDAFADRLADDDEFYYVRARCAEALGYAAVAAPESVTNPETLADLRIGLAFDEPEVKEKLAKALAYVALGDPSRLRHQVSSLADSLDDGSELVRYHLCTALVVVACEDAAKLAEAVEPLKERLDDSNPYVRGRAAEALGLLAASNNGIGSATDRDSIVVADDPPSFVTDRLAFYRQQISPEDAADTPDGVGTIESIRDETDDLVEEMKSPDGGACPHCGLDLPESGPPMCPRCGAPR